MLNDLSNRVFNGSDKGPGEFDLFVNLVFHAVTLEARSPTHHGVKSYRSSMSPLYSVLNSPQVRVLPPALFPNEMAFTGLL
jgi:hypothetical protein